MFLSGLIQLRNELVYYLSANKFPAVKNEERSCSKCSSLTVCSLFNQNKANFESNSDSQTEIQLYSESIKHLSEDDQLYFFKWYKMLELEFNNQKQFESSNLLWWKSVEELETTGFSVFNLQLVKLFEVNGETYSGACVLDLACYLNF